MKPPKIASWPFHAGGGLTHARILHQRAHAGVARRLVGPFDPAKDDRLAILRLHGALEIGYFAGGHVGAPAVDNAQRAFLLEEPGDLGRMVDKALALAVRDTRDHAVDIAELDRLHRVSNFASNPP